MTLEIATVLCQGQGPRLPGSGRMRLIHNEDNRMTPCQAYQRAIDQTKADVLVMIHDDVTVHDRQWLSRIERLFDNPECVAVGLGGATSLGGPDLYRKPYDIWRMARGRYASNQTDAEVHGERFTGDKRVAVLDAFVMAVRVEWLRSRGGWPVGNISHHGLDLWLACEAARDDREIWLTGASVTHHGGGTSTKPEYSGAAWLQGGTLASDHQAPHRWLFNEYRDCLPLVTPQ